MTPNVAGAPPWLLVHASHFRRIQHVYRTNRPIATDIMIYIARLIFALAALVLSASGSTARAELRSGGTLRIEWEVKNRFRLFRDEADFQRHVAAGRGESVLAAERRLARETDGRGWARDVVERLCVDRSGNLLETCDRDGERENYLAPRDHRVGVALAGSIPANNGCVWSFNDGNGPSRDINAACNEEIKVRVRYGRPTLAGVDIVLPGGTAQRLVNEIQVRDVLIAGLGDSDCRRRRQPRSRHSSIE